jgi:uncharacterized repeat protein (TIGR03803 family)
MAILGGILTAANLACAQPFKPDVLFKFPAGVRDPNGALVQGADGSFYGTSLHGGSSDSGTVFRVTTNGALTVLVSFAGTNGMYPGGLTLGSDGNFYGTTSEGGDFWDSGNEGYGTLFRVATNGTLTSIHSFSATYPIHTNSDGAVPSGGLVLGPDGNLYGTSAYGGSYGAGTVFQLTTNGVLTTLASFDGINGNPYAGLRLGNDGNFYGMTTYLLNAAIGTLFRVTTNGMLTTLASFDFGDGWPADEFILSGVTLGSDSGFYGTVLIRTVHGLDDYAVYGKAFRVTMNGVLTTIPIFEDDFYTWETTSDLTLAGDGNLYGIVTHGYGSGFVFQLTTNGILTAIADLGDRIPSLGALTLASDGSLYGTTVNGNSSQYASVFRVTTNGVLATLFSLTDPQGSFPSDLTQAGNGNFYGTTARGGVFNAGTVFQLTTNGAFTMLTSFRGTNGAGPYGDLAPGSDGNFYGTTSGGGEVNEGTVFRVTPDGILTTLASFFGATNGANPHAGLTLGPDGNFYGSTQLGCGQYGGLFRVTTNGTLTALASFPYTNGAFPEAKLALGSDGNFYGTSVEGGANTDGYGRGLGTVFRVTTNGVLTTLVSFDDTNGAFPSAGLTLDPDGNFYGTTADGGDFGVGTVFRVMTNGSLTTLASFHRTNGAYPQAALTLGSDGNFYGTANGGGITNLTTPYGYGTVFQVTTNGVLTTLVSFGWTNGVSPYAALTLGSDGNFYGTAADGGGHGFDGLIYCLRHGVSIQSFGMTTNGFQLNTLNVGGSGWVVMESSSDLTTWTPIHTNGTAAAQQFLDPTALTQPRQFYRVRQE